MNFTEDYYIGLDCGTESVGFAVTDTAYKVLKFNGKSMWGSHLFDEAQTAAERRGYRAARRRLERRKERIRLAQGLFAEEIAKIDPLFFQRLNDSHYFPEDKTVNQPNSLFNDPSFKDKDFFRKYPTIFHLRNALRTGKAEHDPRLLYLAIHHILKNRGHFLFTVSDDLKAATDPKPLFDEIVEISEAVFDGVRISFGDYDAVCEALKEKHISGRKEKLKGLVEFENSKICTQLIALLAGGSVKAEKLFDNEQYKDLPSIEFGKTSFEELVLPVFEDSLSDDEYRLILLFKAVHDWVLLVSVMAGYSFISEAKIAQYNLNNKDLKNLKLAIKLHAPEQYDAFFHGDDAGSFASYVGADHDNGKKRSLRRTSTDEFYKRVRKLIGNNPDDEISQRVLQRIDDGDFLPLLISFRNSVIPYQVHKAEMDEILRVASADYPFLTKKDENGITVIQKLDAILKFKIPYYIGPLGRNDRAVSGWAVRIKDGKILPWNWKNMIDEDASAENFIRNMTNKCTYLPGEDVLPKNSLLYSKFTVLNELNNVRLNGNLLSVEQKQTVYKELFMKYKKVSLSKFRNFIVSEGWYDKRDLPEITGIDGDFKSSLASYLDFKDLLDSNALHLSDVEEIIKWLTLFSEGGDIAKRKIRKAYGAILSSDEISRISRKKYAGWGRLSEKFLTGITAMDKSTGELKSIITMMWETQNNLMELLSSDFEFAPQTGNNEKLGKLEYSIVDELDVSPAVKRQIWQTLKIIDEIEHIMKHPPRKVFLEVTRSKGEKGARTISRKNDLLNKLRNPKAELTEDERNLVNALESYGESEMSRRDKLYLYFTQLGKCMYSGKPIDLAEIGNTDVYDIDHIYPYSRSNDDSLANKVLVLKTENARKSDNFPIDDSVRKKMTPFWEHLHRVGLISSEKLKRLTRSSPLSDEDDKGFIARQLVETSQSAKAVADILNRYYSGQTRIVYSKARNVSDFRDKYSFIKLRSLNNLHHAKDAYLNIVVGNTFDTKYTSDFIANRRDRDPAYNLTKTFDTNVRNAWVAGDDGTIATVRKQMSHNDILYTKQCIEVGGMLFDQMPVSKGSKKGIIPLKSSDPVLKKAISESSDEESAIVAWTDKYGGYNSLKIAYFALVRYRDKKKNVVSFIPISILDSFKLKSKEDLLDYCVNKLHLQDPEIIREKILKNTMISIDGFKYAITGKTGRQLLFESCMPLLLEDSIVRKIKKIEKFLERRKQDKNLLVDEEHDEISREGNLLVYDALLEKAKLPLFMKRPSCQTELIEKSRPKFISLSTEDQCIVIQSLISYFGMGNGGADLSLIGGAPGAGVLKVSARIQSARVFIFDSSVTGLFTKMEEIEV